MGAWAFFFSRVEPIIGPEMQVKDELKRFMATVGSKIDHITKLEQQLESPHNLDPNETSEQPLVEIQKVP